MGKGRHHSCTSPETLPTPPGVGSKTVDGLCLPDPRGTYNYFVEYNSEHTWRREDTAYVIFKQMASGKWTLAETISEIVTDFWNITINGPNGTYDPNGNYDGNPEVTD